MVGIAYDLDHDPAADRHTITIDDMLQAFPEGYTIEDHERDAFDAWREAQGAEEWKREHPYDPTINKHASDDDQPF